MSELSERCKFLREERDSLQQKLDKAKAFIADVASDRWINIGHNDDEKWVWFGTDNLQTEATRLLKELDVLSNLTPTTSSGSPLDL